MARSARRSASAPRGGRGGMPWLGIWLLIAIGVAVFAARTIKLPRSAEPSLAEPTQVVAATRQPQLVQPTVQATPPPAATPQPAAQPTAVRARSTPSPTQAAVAATHRPVVATAPSPTRESPTAVAVLVAAGPTATTTVARAGSGEVALTFDAGADRGYAEDILDVLQEQHVLASFGITGLWAKANPDLVRRMAADGHLVFNHTLDHRSFTGVSDKLGGLSAARRRAELDDADAIIAPLLGHTTRPFYRLPYGDDDANVAADVAPDGYLRKVGWTVDSLGWRGSASTDIIARCLKLAAPGAVYVLHVGRASQDALALPQVIAGLRDKGFSFRRIDQG